MPDAHMTCWVIDTNIAFTCSTPLVLSDDSTKGRYHVMAADQESAKNTLWAVWSRRPECKGCSTAQQRKLHTQLWTVTPDYSCLKFPNAFLGGSPRSRKVVIKGKSAHVGRVKVHRKTSRTKSKKSSRRRSRRRKTKASKFVLYV